MHKFGRIVILVDDYEDAIHFYRDKLGFEVFVDLDADDQRFVHVKLPSQKNIGIWLLKAQTEEQIAAIGRQTAGAPCAVIYTHNIKKDVLKLEKNGVHFNKPIMSDEDAAFAHFVDLYGNEFVLVELKP